MLKILRSVTIFIISLCICQIIMADEMARIVGFKVITNPGKTKIIFNLSSKCQYDMFSMEDPSRVVIDLTDTSMSTHINNSLLHNTIVKEIRYATHEDGVLRLVLDLRKNTNFDSKISSNKQGKTSLIIILADPSVLKKQAQKKTLPQPPKEEGNNSKVSEVINQVDNKSLAADMSYDKKRTIQNSVSVLNSPPKNIDLNKLRDITIVIDPGHGGKDPGVTGVHKTKEKNVVLAVAKELRKLLNMEIGIKAVLTRNDDYFLPLKERLRIAHNNKADLFVSLHADAYKRHTISGVSVFALGENGATSEVAQWLAEKENVSELGNNLSQNAALRSVLLGLAQKNTLRTSLDIGDSIIEQLPTIAKIHNHQVEQANFIVLKSPDIPSLLIETGFLSEPKEEKKLNNANYESNLAKAIEAGIFNYFKYHPIADTHLAIATSSNQSEITATNSAKRRDI